MDSNDRTVGIIATVAAVLLCGLPGLLGLCVGALFAVISFIPGAEIDMMGSSDPGSALGFGLVTLCFSILFVLIPVLVGYYTLRKRTAAVGGPISASSPSRPADVYTPTPEPRREEWSEPRREERPGVDVFPATPAERREESQDDEIPPAI